MKCFFLYKLYNNKIILLFKIIVCNETISFDNGLVNLKLNISSQFFFKAYYATCYYDS